MNAPLDLKMDKPSFLRWVERQEGRYELADGKVVQQMNGDTFVHFDLIDRIQKLLAARLDTEIWATLPAGFAVDVGNSIRFPDAILQKRALLSATDLSTATPTIIFEILSPSSLTLDMIVKPGEYTALASLEAYVVVSQFEPRVTVWQRPAGEGGNRPFPRMPIELDKPEDRIAVAGVGLVLELADIYRNIREFP